MVDPRILIAVLAMACEAGPKGAGDLAAARRESRSSAYEAPSRAELDGASRLFDDLLAPRPDVGKARALAAQCDLELLEVDAPGDSILVVRETAAARRGRGFFAFRPGQRRPLAIEAPHSFTDRYTGPIAEKLFLESGAAAAAWNTVARSAAPEGTVYRKEDNRETEGEREREGEKKKEGEENDSDLAHLPESFLQEFTRAFARAHPGGIVLQLHGFDSEARGGDGPSAILSDGTRRPGVWVEVAAGCLSDALGARTALYPRDTSELGGTSNAQAKLLRALGSRSFLHLELSLDRREDLAREAELRKRLLLCIPETVP